MYFKVQPKGTGAVNLRAQPTTASNILDQLNAPAVCCLLKEIILSPSEKWYKFRKLESGLVFHVRSDVVSVGRAFDLTDYLRGDGRVYKLRYEWGSGGTQVLQTDRQGVRWYTNKGGEWEEFWYDRQFIYRGTDTSPGGGEVYLTSSDSMAYGHRAYPRFMRVGESYAAAMYIEFRQKATGHKVIEKPKYPFTVNTKLVAHHEIYTFKNGLTLPDVLEFHNTNQGSGFHEIMWFARNYGLVGWREATRDESWISYFNGSHPTPPRALEALHWLQRPAIVAFEDYEPCVEESEGVPTMPNEQEVNSTIQNPQFGGDPRKEIVAAGRNIAIPEGWSVVLDYTTDDPQRLPPYIFNTANQGYKMEFFAIKSYAAFVQPLKLTKGRYHLVLGVHPQITAHGENLFWGLRFKIGANVYRHDNGTLMYNGQNFQFNGSSHGAGEYNLILQVDADEVVLDEIGLGVSALWADVNAVFYVWGFGLGKVADDKMFPSVPDMVITTDKTVIVVPPGGSAGAPPSNGGGETPPEEPGEEVPGEVIRQKAWATLSFNVDIEAGEPLTDADKAKYIQQFKEFIERYQ